MLISEFCQHCHFCGQKVENKNVHLRDKGYVSCKFNGAVTLTSNESSMRQPLISFDLLCKFVRYSCRVYLPTASRKAFAFSSSAYSESISLIPAGNSYLASLSTNGSGSKCSGPHAPASFQMPLAMSSIMMTGLTAVCATTEFVVYLAIQS